MFSGDTLAVRKNTGFSKESYLQFARECKLGNSEVFKGTGLLYSERSEWVYFVNFFSTYSSDCDIDTFEQTYDFGTAIKHYAKTFQSLCVGISNYDDACEFLINISDAEDFDYFYFGRENADSNELGYGLKPTSPKESCAFLWSKVFTLSCAEIGELIQAEWRVGNTGKTRLRRLFQFSNLNPEIAYGFSDSFETEIYYKKYVSQEIRDEYELMIV